MYPKVGIVTAAIFSGLRNIACFVFIDSHNSRKLQPYVTFVTPCQSPTKIQGHGKLGPSLRPSQSISSSFSPNLQTIKTNLSRLVTWINFAKPLFANNSSFYSIQKGLWMISWKLMIGRKYLVQIPHMLGNTFRFCKRMKHENMCGVWRPRPGVRPYQTTQRDDR